MASMINRLTRLARSPQGRKLVGKAQRYANSPEGKKKIEETRKRLAKRR